MADDGMVDFESAESFGGNSGGFVDKAGTYHLNGVTMHIRELPNHKSYAGWSAAFEVVGGTDESQVGKTLWIRMGDYKEGKSETFWKELRTAFLVACGFLKIEDIGKSVRFNPNAPGVFQCVAEIAESADDRDPAKKFYNLKFANIYHVDDPAVAGIPKDANSLSFIDPSRRYPDPKSFDPLVAMRDGKKHATQTAKNQESTSPATFGV